MCYRVKDILCSNGYPSRIISNRPHNHVDKVKPLSNVVLPYIQGCSERLARILKKYNIFTIHKPINKLSSIFGLPKDPVPVKEVCGVVYDINCKDCSQHYIGQTKNSLQTRLQQHRSAWRLCQPEKSALAEHAITQSHAIDWDTAKVIHRETSWHQRIFAEAFHACTNNDVMNRCDLSLPSVYKRL